MPKYKLSTMPSQDAKVRLIETYHELKKSNDWFKKRLRLYPMELATGIKMSTIGYQIRYNRLNDENYQKLLAYISQLQNQYTNRNELSKLNLTEI